MSMQAILSASQSVTRMQSMHATSKQAQGQANVLRAESKQDGGDVQKEEQAKALEEKSINIVGDLMNEVADVNETLKPEEEVKKDTDTEQAEKEPKTDKLELSYSAAEQSGKGLPVTVAVGEPVTYKADGSTVPNVAEKNNREISLTA